MPRRTHLPPACFRTIQEPQNALVYRRFLLLTIAATVVENPSNSHQQRPLIGKRDGARPFKYQRHPARLYLLLLGRQLAKIYFEKKKSPFGAGFKTKLVTAFIARRSSRRVFCLSSPPDF